MEFERSETIPQDVKEWHYRPMFKDNANGAKMLWRIGFDGSNIVVHHGHVDGAIQTELVEVTTNNSGRSLHDQAVLEINNRYLKKHREGYRDKNEPPPIKGPMLAHKYEHGKTKLNYPVGCTVKLDGIRCLIRHENDKVIYRSRNNKEYNHLAVFDECMAKFFELLPPSIELDGEMYSDELTFNDISSVFRKEKNTDNKQMLKYIRYYIFDCNLEKPYEDRWSMLVNAYQKLCEIYDGEVLIVVVNTFWAKNDNELLSFHRHARSKGYEGTMIRKLYISDKTPKGYTSSLYLSGRKNNILKLKDIEEEEGIVLGVEEGKGREKGLALIRVKDPRGNEFSVRPSATFEQRKIWFDEPESIVGKKITYQFQNLSEFGVPRFPVGKDIRDYE
jgi:ATP-dependent DNA ligase